jgi:hypothetical protein
MDLEILKEATENNNEHFLDIVKLSKTSQDAAEGVAKLLLANDGDQNVLKGKQQYVYESCIAPLFNVDCEGIFGEGTCTGDEKVDEPSLLLSYQEGNFLCQHCRYDAQKIADDRS